MILLPIFLPFAGAMALGLWGTPRVGAIANAGLSFVVFLLTLAAFAAPGYGLIHADGLGLLFGAQTGFGILDKTNTKALGGALYNLAEAAEALHRGKALRLQNELGFKILHAVKRCAVRIKARSSRGGNARGRLIRLGLRLHSPLGLALFLVFCLFYLRFCLRLAHGTFPPQRAVGKTAIRALAPYRWRLCACGAMAWQRAKTDNSMNHKQSIRA